MSYAFWLADREPGRDPAAAHDRLLRACSTAGSSGSRPTSSRCKATIAELITATEIAERAIAGLKTTVREGEQTLGERLRRGGKRCPPSMERQLKAGEVLLARLIRIAGSPPRPRRRSRPRAFPIAKAVVAAAQAFAERARARLRVQRSGRMIRLLREFRLIPIVLVATICLFALKASGLVFDGGYTLAERLQGRNKTGMQVTSAESVPDYPKIIVADQQAAPAAPAAARPGNPGRSRCSTIGDRSDITGSVGAEEQIERPAAQGQRQAAGAAQAGSRRAAPCRCEPGRIASAGERAILERLQERREELDARGRELEMRESLLKAAEKRLGRQGRRAQGRWRRASTPPWASATRRRRQRFKSLVTMYENMKAKDAARIFDRLDMKMLVEVATKINPRRMSDILAQMTPEAAERLTVELARRADRQAAEVRTSCRRSRASRTGPERMIPKKPAPEVIGGATRFPE